MEIQFFTTHRAKQFREWHFLVVKYSSHFSLHTLCVPHRRPNLRLCLNPTGSHCGPEKMRPAALPSAFGSISSNTSSALTSPCLWASISANSLARSNASCRREAASSSPLFLNCLGETAAGRNFFCFAGSSSLRFAAVSPKREEVMVSPNTKLQKILQHLLPKEIRR